MNKAHYDLEAVAPTIIETKDMRAAEVAELLGLSKDQVLRARKKLGVDKKTKLNNSLPELANLGHLSCGEAAEVLGLTRNQVANLRHKYGLGRGVSWHKGKPPANKQCIGARHKVNLHRRTFYMIKVTDTNDYHADWVLEHRYVWEQAHGKLEDGWKVIHLDGDCLNNELSNLYAISKQVQMNLNYHKWHFKNEPEKQLCAIKNCELTTELSKQGLDFHKFYKEQEKQERRNRIR